MSILHLLSKVSSFAARTPNDPKEIDQMLQLVADIVQQQFDAYLVDIMWETGQGHRTALKAIKKLETEKYGYESRSVYRESNGVNVPDSLTGWCYENNQPVWVVDENGLLRKNSYPNLWDEEAGSIPADTIYQYNKAKIPTEICYPLRTNIDEKGSRAAGVLNVEIKQFLYPSASAQRFVMAAASVIEQLQTQILSHWTAAKYSNEAIEELKRLKAKITKDEPGFVPSAFVAMPMSTPEEVKEWIEAVLKARGISCSWPETNGQISDEIWKRIRTAHFGIVVTTGFNRNVLLEWGYLLGCRKPIIRLHASSGDGEVDPFDVAGMKRWSIDKGKAVTKESVSAALNGALNVLLEENQELVQVINFRSEAAASL